MVEKKDIKNLLQIKLEKQKAVDDRVSSAIQQYKGKKIPDKTKQDSKPANIDKIQKYHDNKPLAIYENKYVNKEIPGKTRGKVSRPIPNSTSTKKNLYNTYKKKSALDLFRESMSNKKYNPKG